MAINHKNFAQTTLGAAIESVDGTSITVTSEAGFPAVDFIISIDTEAMLVTTVSTTTWTVTRGYEGSTAATHLNGAAIYHDWSAAEADSTVHGPASATDTHLAVFDSTTGKLIKDGGAVTAAGLALLDDATTEAQRATLGIPIVRSFTTAMSQANFVTMCADMDIDIIEMESGTYQDWHACDISVDRSTRPLLVRPAPGATVIWDGSTDESTDGLFYFGNSSLCSYIRFDAFGTGGVFKIQNYTLGATGLINTTYVSHLAFNDVIVRGCLDSASEGSTRWDVYLGDDNVHRNSDLEFCRWDTISGDAYFNHIQVKCNPGADRVVFRDWFISGGNYGAYANYDCTGVVFDNLHIVDNGNVAIEIADVTAAIVKNCTATSGSVYMGTLTADGGGNHATGTTLSIAKPGSAMTCDIIASDVTVTFDGQDTDGYCNFVFKSNDTQVAKIFGETGDMEIAGDLTVNGVDITAAGLALLDDANAAAQLATLGAAALSGATFTGNVNINTPDTEVAGYNKYHALLSYNSNVLLRYQDFVWNGAAYVASSGYGFGYQTLQNNTGSYSNGFGYQTLQNNTGSYSNGFGYQTLQSNTGSYSNGFGHAALQNNTGSYSSGFGYRALYWNNWPYAIGVGHQDAGYFLDNAASAKTFATANITANTITFGAAHGFGTVGGKVNLRFTTTAGTPPTGLVSNTVYQFTVTSTTILTLSGIGTNASGDFTGKVTISVNITNSVALGYNANASKANQVVLGNASVTEVDAGTAGCAVLLTKQLQLSALNTAPANAGDTGTAGEVRWASGYVYLCVATNTWQRAALATW